MKKETKKTKPKKEKTIADEFKVTEKEYDKIWENFKKTDMKHDDLIKLIKDLFPKSKEDQVKAYFLFMDGTKRGEEGHKCC